MSQTLPAQGLAYHQSHTQDLSLELIHLTETDTHCLHVQYCSELKLEAGGLMGSWGSELASPGSLKLLLLSV